MKNGSLLFWLIFLAVLNSCSKTDSTGNPTSGSTPSGSTPSGPDTAIIITEYDPKPVSKTNTQNIYVHYMPWFEDPSTSPDGKWGTHWTMANENPDIIFSNGRRQIASYFYPMIGPYASSDPDVLDYHTLLMKYSGIDGVIVDWGGSHDVYDYSLSKRNTEALFGHMPKVGLKFSVCYEDATLQYVKTIGGINTIPAAQQDFQYLQTHFFGSDQYIKINNEPLVLCFGPQVMKAAGQWQRSFQGLTIHPYLLSLWYQGDPTGSEGRGEFSWVSSDYLPGLQRFYQHRAGTLTTAFGCAYPGFKDFYAAGGWGSTLFVLDHNGTSTLQATLDLAKTSGLANIQLVTWNDFGEGTMIEPTLDFNFDFLVAVQQYTGVQYTQTELALIYRWFTLRKKYKGHINIESKLTQAYYFLVSLDPASASAIMNTIP